MWALSVHNDDGLDFASSHMFIHTASETGAPPHHKQLVQQVHTEQTTDTY